MWNQLWRWFGQHSRELTQPIKGRIQGAEHVTFPPSLCPPAGSEQHTGKRKPQGHIAGIANEKGCEPRAHSIPPFEGRSTTQEPVHAFFIVRVVCGERKY